MDLALNERASNMKIASRRAVLNAARERDLNVSGDQIHGAVVNGFVPVADLRIVKSDLKRAVITLRHTALSEAAYKLVNEPKAKVPMKWVVNGAFSPVIFLSRNIVPDEDWSFDTLLTAIERAFAEVEKEFMVGSGLEVVAGISEFGDAWYVANFVLGNRSALERAINQLRSEGRPLSGLVEAIEQDLR